MIRKSPKTVPLSSKIPSPATAEIPETTTPPDITKLPYYIQRIRPSGQLPIYTDLKAMGTLKQTRIRKISGDGHALKRELKEFLGIQKDKDCAVNPVTGHIILKGHWRNEVDEFFVAKGF
jgi:large subunit ribosomal protein L49